MSLTHESKDMGPSGVASGRTWQFGPFTLDEHKQELRRDGRRVELTGYPYRILEYLIRHRDRLVSKADLVGAVWGHGAATDVNDGALRTHLYTLRQTLGDNADKPTYILTANKGYRFVFEPVTEGADRQSVGALAERARSGRNALARQNGVGLHGFAYPRAEWLDAATGEALTELAKSALILLAFDRTGTGCWGKSYLYRRKTSDEGVPSAQGSLSGTSVAMVAIGAVVDDACVLHDSFCGALVDTLARLFVAKNGRYLRGRGFSDMGKVPLWEPCRHVAGAVLTKLLLNRDSTADLKTIEYLCEAILEDMSWERTIVARALAHAVILQRTPPALKSRVKVRVGVLLQDLAAPPKSVAALSWADPYSYGRDVNNQWGTVFYLLPFISRALPSGRAHTVLADRLRQFLLAQGASTDGNESLLPGLVDADGKGRGRYVFGTTIAVVAWRTLQFIAQTPDGAQEAMFHARGMAMRLIGNRTDALEIPSVVDPSNPSALEGYLGWAGLLLAAGTLGIRIGVHELQATMRLASELESLAATVERDTLQSTFSSVLSKSGLLGSQSVPVVARTLARISQL